MKYEEGESSRRGFCLSDKSCQLVLCPQWEVTQLIVLADLLKETIFLFGEISFRYAFAVGYEDFIWTKVLCYRNIIADCGQTLSMNV